MATRDQITALLRETPKTISELAAELGVARNAISFQLHRLIAEGIVEKGTIRRKSRAGKPAQEYKITPGKEDLGSHAYTPFVKSLLVQLPKHLSPAKRKSLLEQVGKHMAVEAGLSNNEDFQTNLRAAINLVNKLGATAEWYDDDDQVIVRNISCPLAGAVRVEPCVCDAVAAFFTEATGAKTTASCQHDENLVCRYIIEKQSA
ncbi:MAG: hypothetical protein DHS20C08_11120 [Rhodomicrobium sp.]|nr:MAG: hypothetical protein DHS20C08_11120 [Rhodomicrobium sp.]